MRITVVSHDLGTNAYGRAHVLAELASRFADVSVVGPSSTGRVWEPLRDDERFAPHLVSGALPTVNDIVGNDPDVVIAVKARHASLTTSLRITAQLGVPLVADVDDDELAFYVENPRWWLKQSVRLNDPNSYWATRRAQRRVAGADSVTVASSALQSRFGGEVVVHARSASTFDPSKADGRAVREELGLAREKVVLFMGSARPHKGLPDVVAALELLGDPHVHLVVVGDGADLPARPWIHVVPNRPLRDVPRYLAAADVVVLAQRDGPIARAQVPAKIFDAMAMGRPVVTTAVSDLPAIVGDTAVVVPADNPAELCSAIRAIVSDEGYAKSLGAAARERFMRLFDLDAVYPELEAAVLRAVSSRAATTDAGRARSTASSLLRVRPSIRRNR